MDKWENMPKSPLTQGVHNLKIKWSKDKRRDIVLEIETNKKKNYNLLKYFTQFIQGRQN